MRYRRSRRAAKQLAYLILLTLAIVSCRGPQEVWKILPPVPTLPTANESGYAPVNDIEMWYATFGQGQPVVLLHGGLSSSDYWGNLVPVLMRHQFRVIVADSRGHGRSTRSQQPYSYDLMASDVLGLMDYLKLERVDLVGWSDGGIIGIDIAISHPERLHRMFVFGANTDPSGLIESFDRTPVFAAFIKRSGDEYRKLSRTPDEYNAFLDQIGHMWATQPHFTDDQLRRISVPTTIADGQYDEGIKQSHDVYMAGMIPTARLVILPNVSHFAMLQNPAAFNAAVLSALTAR